MKNKKLVMTMVALTMSAATALAFTACKPEEPAHEHNYSWENTKPATCETAGEKTGTCECGDTKKEPIPALGHNYGDWEVAAIPTTDEAGSAKRVCANDTAHAHDITVTLPVLGDSIYNVTEDFAQDTYVYAHEDGNISFNYVKEVKSFSLDEDSLDEFYWYSTEIEITIAEKATYTFNFGSDAFVLYASPENYQEGVGIEMDYDTLTADCTLEAGTYTFVASAVSEGDYTFSFAKKVVVPVTSVSFEQTSVTAKYGEAIELTPVFNNRATDTRGTWTSDNEDVVVISQHPWTGAQMPLACGVGTANLTFTSYENDEVSASVEVTVTADALTLGENTIETKADEMYSFFKFQGEPETEYSFSVSGLDAGVTYNLAKAAGGAASGSYTSGSLTVTTDANGEVFIAVNTSEQCTATLTVSMPVYATSFKVVDENGDDLTELELALSSYHVGDFSKTLNVVFNPENTTDTAFTVSVSETAALTYSAEFDSITLNAVGEATVTLTYTHSPELTYSFKIKVTNTLSLSVGGNYFGQMDPPEGANLTGLTSLPNTQTECSFIGDPDTEYAVDFTSEWMAYYHISKSLHDVDEYDELDCGMGYDCFTNYVPNETTGKFYIVVTTDSDGVGKVYVMGMVGGTLNIVKLSEYSTGKQYQTDDFGTILDLDENPDLSTDVDEPTYYSFMGLPETEYAVTFIGAWASLTECGSDKTATTNTVMYSWGMESITLNVTTDVDGKAYFFVTNEDGWDPIYYTLVIGEPAAEEPIENGYDYDTVALQVGTTNSKIDMMGSYSPNIFAFQGEAEHTYTVSVMGMAPDFIGQSDVNGEWLDEASGFGSCNITTDADGKAFITFKYWDNASVHITVADAE